MPDKKVSKKGIQIDPRELKNMPIADVYNKVMSIKAENTSQRLEVHDLLIKELVRRVVLLENR